MADDEGAEYWQSVYGQPVHTYGGGRAGLEAMGEEEYAAYVRARMWERTEEGREEVRKRARAEALREKKAQREERRRRRTEREKARMQERNFLAEEEARNAEIAQRLAKGEARKRRKDGMRQWSDYVANWEAWSGMVADLVWPLPGGGKGHWGQRNVSESGVRAFVTAGLEGGDESDDEDDEKSRAELVARLREERVRWHPDKMQQRLGGKVEDGVMRDVTAVFQILDKIWSQVREKR
jgi:hypothetical protein